MLFDQIQSDLTTAMKARDELKIGTLRLLLSALKNEKIDMGKDQLEDTEVVRIIQRQIKQRQDSIGHYMTGGRKDLAEQEMREVEILKSYLPAMMSEADILNIIQKKKTELNITDKSGLGRLMGEIMKEVTGKADGNLVSQLVAKSFS